ncbi:MAG: hypothetical protein D6820_11015, partial [Lentisphaerae bacterium]
MTSAKEQRELEQLQYFLEQEINNPYQSVDEYLELRNPENIAQAYKPQPHYHIEKFLARGGMGNVFVVNDLNIRRQVAMKVLRREQAQSEHIRRFINEARITGQLEHPNIVPVHQLAVTMDGTVFYTMKLIEGPTLKQILSGIVQQKEEFIHDYPLTRLLRIFLNAANAIAFAHSRNIIHRDLKPENIIAGPFGQVMVLDWGLARILEQQEEEASDIPDQISINADREETACGTIMGTPPYMAPEQIRGDTYRVDQRSDIYALGAILYSILTLKIPFHNLEDRELIEAKHRGDLTPPDQILSDNNYPLPHIPGPKVPASLSAICMKAMAPLPEERYQSVHDLQADIEAYLAGFATQAEEPDLFRMLSLLIKRRWREVSAILAMLTLVFIFVMLSLRNQIQHRQQLQDVNAKLQLANQKLQQLSRKAAPLFLDHALRLINAQQWEKARESIISASRSDPNAPLPVVHIIRYLIYTNQLDEAAKRIDELANSNDPIVQGWLSRLRPVILCARRNRLPSQTDTALPPNVLYKMAVSAAKHHDRELAIGLIRKAITLAVEQKDLSLATNATIFDVRLLNPALQELPFHVSYSADGYMHLKIMPNPLVRDLSPLGMLPLRQLDIAGCSKVENIDFIAKLPLRYLNLKETMVTNFPELPGSRITHLNLAHTPIANLKPLSSLRQLKELDISWCKNLTSFSLKHLAGLPIITLRANYTRTIQDLSPLTALPTLQELELEQTSITDISPLAKLNRLQKLNLSGTYIKTVTPLSKLPLRELTLAYTPIDNV